MQPERRTFKIFHPNDDIRRISLVNPPAWDDFVNHMIGLNSAYHPEMKVSYVDSDGDKCTVSCQEEWEAMLDALKNERIIKLNINEGVHEGTYFKDGPPPQPQCFYLNQPTTTEGLQNEDEATEEKSELAPESVAQKLGKGLSELEITIPKCLERLFKGGKILPYNLPAWLQKCVQIKRVDSPDNVPVVDLDVDICQLFDVLHQKALEGIDANKETHEIEQAKEYLNSMLAIRPDHPVALYNLACAESLLGNLNEAVDALTKAVRIGGYSNVEHIQRDSDLDNIRAEPGYLALVKEIQQSQAKPEEEESPKQEAAEQVEEKQPAEPEIPPKIKEEKKQEKEKPKKAEKPFRWEKQLQEMVNMGFDREASKTILTIEKGNLNRAVNSLLI